MCLLILSAPTNLQSEDGAVIIGTIVKVRGKIARINKNLRKKEFLQIGSKIYEYDVIGSGHNSFVKILMKDDTIFQLGPRSKFIFEKFSFNNKKNRKAVYNLLIGKLRSLFTNQTENGEDLKLKTPNAAMAVRGTEILSDVYVAKENLQTDIALISGRLEVRAFSGATQDQKAIDLRPGFIFEAKGNNNKTSLGPNGLKKIPQEVLMALKNPNNKGGQTFLSDARLAHLREIQKTNHLRK